MWRLPEEIEADLHSQSSDRVAAGLRDLKECMDEFDEFELAPLDIAILKPFGSYVPTETQLNLFFILASYRSFKPPLSSEDINHALLSLALLYADDRIALETSLKLKSEQNPSVAVKDAINFIAHSSLDISQQIEGASHLVSYLIAGKPEVRYATLEALSNLPKQQKCDQIIGFIKPELESEELKLFYQH
jgi:hypothetical protein